MPAKTVYLDWDVVRIYERDKPRRKEHLLATLFWGDELKKVGEEADGSHIVELSRFEWVQAGHFELRTYEGVVPAKVELRGAPVLKVRFVDVGQGDGALVETPKGRRILIDGGEEQHMRRYLQVAFSHVLRDGPLELDAIVVTHGDADHYAGLTRLAEASRGDGKPLITASRVFHNGLVKAGETLPNGRNRPEAEVFGRSERKGPTVYALELEDDLTQLPDARMNRFFLEWRAALRDLQRRSVGFEMRRLAYGVEGAFDFLEPEDIRVEVLGPIVEKVGGEDALPFFHQPGSNSLSASHTINGHSVVLKLAYGNVRFLFGADLNEESEERLLERARRDGRSLSAEVLKVPHHGSADFSPSVLAAIRPVVSVVSSGDENATKEYIHPRAGLMGALGKYSRSGVDRPLVYVTEMVAFFQRLGRVKAEQLKENGRTEDLGIINNAYAKTAFGIVHVRTDGKRVLVATHSGKSEAKESYAFRVDARGEVAFEDVKLA